jgi:4'-phosphopantetheinyl transferase
VSGIGSDWITPTRWPDLPDSAVHVWLASLDAWRGALPACCGVLRGDEQDRASRYREGEPRTRYQMTRGVLRLLLARYLKAPPTAIAFSYNTHGKPELLGDGPPFHFNVSHTGDFSVFAFAREGAIGVDIERVRADMTRQDEIAQRHFAPGEYRALQQIPAHDRTRAFFRCWARKEAVLKARGDGIFGGLQTFEVNVDGSSARILHGAGDFRTDQIVLADLPEVPGCSGAVALLHSYTRDVSFEHWLSAPGSLLDGNSSATNV